ncbi:hypothetical protein [Streptomyces achromogenes]|uniref:hypothetical protein n=1 Tax=Streptomyces achromogenes TaxID=67255 RepID=UPI003A80F7DA
MKRTATETHLFLDHYVPLSLLAPKVIDQLLLTSSHRPIRRITAALLNGQRGINMLVSALSRVEESIQSRSPIFRLGGRGALLEGDLLVAGVEGGRIGTAADQQAPVDAVQVRRVARTAGGGGSGGRPWRRRSSSSAHAWITDQTDFSAPTVTCLDAESVLAVPDSTSTADPAPLVLDSGAAPGDYDAGDHVNLTADGYKAIAGAIDLTTLGPDA